MTEIERKRNDTTPLTGILRENGDPADLSQASSVSFYMKADVDSELKASGTATIVDETGGEVRYEVSADEVDESGYFLAEWEVEYADGTVHTFPNGDYLTIQFKDDLS
jgi:hypothetical protein